MAPQQDRSAGTEKTRYVEQPTEAANQQRREKQAALYRAYVTEKSERVEQRRNAWTAQRESEKARFSALASQARARREEIKASNAPVAEKKAALKLAAMDRVLMEQQLRERIAGERADLRAEYGRMENYRQYVTRRAQEGDEAALSALRGMKPDTQERDKQAGDNAIRSTKPTEPHDVLARGPLYKGQVLTHQVHRNSDVSYSLNGRVALRDEGRVIRVHESKNADAIELGLRLAQKKYGEKITLTGDDEFKALAVRTAVERGVKVSFVDPNLEAMRLRLIEQHQATTTAHRAADRHQDKPQEPIEKIVFDVPFKEKNEAAEIGLKWDRAAKGYSAEKGSAAAQQAAQRWPEKKDEQTHQKPLEAAPGESDVKMQGEAEKTPQQPDARPQEAQTKRDYISVADFIGQRNETAKKVHSLPPHRLVKDGENIDGRLEGIRTVGAQKVALIENTDGATKKKEIIVVPLTQDTDKNISSKNKGSRVEGRYEANELHVS